MLLRQRRDGAGRIFPVKRLVQKKKIGESPPHSKVRLLKGLEIGLQCIILSIPIRTHLRQVTGERAQAH
jgi:hypothetical protein